MKNFLIFTLILIFVSIFRFVGINWDSGGMLHPDERFLIMVVEKMTFPESIVNYLDTKNSTLNPHNIGFPYYVYGTLPLVILRGLANLLTTNSLPDLFILGRYLSGFVDLLICVVVFCISKKLTQKNIVAFFSMLLYGLTVLPIQLAHFFAVDPFLVLFNSISLLFLISFLKEKKFNLQLVYAIFSGISFGLAVSSKISALYVLPAILLVPIFHYIRNKKINNSIFCSVLFLLSTIIVIRFAFPTLFESKNLFTNLNPEVISDWKELNHFYSHSTYKEKGSYIFPPATMFLSTKPYIFPSLNLVTWGIGIPITLLVFGSIFALKKHTKLSYQLRHNYLWLIPILWILSIFLIQGAQFLLYLRYFYPIIPITSILAGYTLSKIFSKKIYIGIIILIIIFIWPISFLRIYLQPHTRVAASEWIYTSIPPGSSIAFEHWDDPLPLYLPGYSNSSYTFIELPLFDQESKSKWRLIYDRLNQSDYLVISSNRVYGSTTAVPDRFPTTTKYYELLFSGRLGFEKIGEFVSRPGINFPINICIVPPFGSYGKIYSYKKCDGISFVDDYSDESFTVYDHPKVIIFRRTGIIPNLGI